MLMDQRLSIKSSNIICIIINNTCNMTCNNCGTLQCYNFNGTYRWSEEKDLYEKWAEVADFPEIDIMGGEPYLNPELLDWALNIKRLWPNSIVNVGTNGTLLHTAKNIKITRKFIDAGVILSVSGHDINLAEKILSDIWNIFEPYKDEIQTKQDADNKEMICFYKNGRMIAKYHPVYFMYPNYVKRIKDGTLYLDDGDAEESHKNCIYSTNCYTLQKGLFYKCPLVTNYAELKTQVRYEERAIPLIEKFKPCSPYSNKEEIESFFEKLDKPIDACKLCAFEKKKDPLKPNRPVTFDKSMKKEFRGPNGKT